MTDDVTNDPTAGATPEPAEPTPPTATPALDVTPVAVSTVRVAKRPRRTPLLAALAVLVVGGIGAATVVLLRTGERDADEALAAARAAVEDADSFRFTARSTSTLVEGDSDNSTETTTRTTEEGEWAAGAWHVTSADDYSASETIVDADGVTYDRWADGEDAAIGPDDQWDRYEMPDELAGTMPDDLVEAVEQYAEMSDVSSSFAGESDEFMDAAYADESAVGLAVSLYLGGGGFGDGAVPGGGLFPFATGFGAGFGDGSDPTGFLAAIDTYGEPQLDDPQTITATLRAPAELSEALARPIPDGEVTLTLGPDDQPVRVHLRVAAERAANELELTFEDWNGGLTVAIPTGDEVDPTPWVEEEEIRAVRVTPVAPTAVPAGWTPMVTVMAMDEYRGEGGADCDVLDLSYDEPLPADALEEPEAMFEYESGYVWLYQSTLDCALAADDTPFEPGGPAGLPHRSPDHASTEVLVGDTAVEVDSSLPPDELAALLASLAPVDVEALVTAAAVEPPEWTL